MTEPVYRMKRALGVFERLEALKASIEKLKDEGFNMKQISAIAKDDRVKEEIPGSEITKEEKEAGNKAGQGAAVGTLAGGTLGGIAGLLVGLGALAIPGVGPILLAGAEATTIATALAGGAIGAASGGLIGALVGLGIPEERAKVYSDRVANGDYLLMLTGTQAEIEHAEAILQNRPIQEWGIYDIAPMKTKDVEAKHHPGIGVTNK
jgi:hypothetical protein